MIRKTRAPQVPSPVIKSLLIVSVFFLAQYALAQTPVTQNTCDPRSTANNGNCPASCVFFVGDIPKSNPTGFTNGVEKGCNCFDNLDNDGDGKVDAADTDCFAYFGLTFVAPGEDCSITPPGANTPFDLVGPPAVSGQNTADTQSKVAAGDVDGNGVPDAVITSKWNSEVRVIATAASTGLAKFGGDAFSPGNVIADLNLDAGSVSSRFASCDGVNSKNLLFEHEVLIADINRDGDAEIFCVVSNRLGAPTSTPSTFYLIAMEITAYGPGGLKLMYDPVCLGKNRPGTFGIADMDGDGKAEIYLRDRIFAAETGKLLASEGAKLMTGTGTANWDINVSSAPVAVDIKSAGNDGGKMELVVGAQIYTIPNLTNRNPASPAALTLFRNMNSLVFDINGDGLPDQYFVKLMNDPAEYGIDTHASTSVADIDKDGHVDVVITGAINSSSGRTAVFYWNVRKGFVNGVLTPSSADLGLTPANTPDYNNYLSGWIWGTGRVNIGDADADGKLDLTYISGAHLFCMSIQDTTNAAGQRLYSVWTQNSKNLPSSGGVIPVGYRIINDTRSGVLTVTLYDFDNNGTTELVYRDSEELAIVDGATGVNKLFSRTCRSHTYTEGPIIADVNGDGNTDICVACNRSDNPAQFNINAGIQQQSLGEIRMYFSSGEWLPTRRVWNQPGYFVVNIKDDLTLPFPQFDIALKFTGMCASGPPGARTPFNVFLNQVPFLSSTGCPIFPAPDLTFIGDDPNDPNVDPNNPNYFPKVFVESPICGNLDLKVGFNITNSGNIPISTSIPVSFFVGSPYDVNNPGTLLHSSTININNLQVKDTLSIGDLLDESGNLIRAGDLPFIEFDGPGTIFTLYVVLYNDGSVLPIDTTSNQKQNGQVESSAECDITNNFWPILVTPKPFTVNIDSIDNVTCSLVMPPPPPYNGQLISHISVGPDTVIDLSPYRFRWYTSSDTTSSRIPGESNYNLQNIAGGDYYLVIDNVQKGCSSDPILGQVLNSTTAIVDFTVTTTDQFNCEPPDGSAQANITSGNAGYEITWEDENGGIVGSGPTLNNLRAGTYTARVRETATDCELFKDGLVSIGFALPEVQPFAEGVVNCLNPSSGKLTAIAYKTFDGSGNPIPEDSTKYTFDWYFYDFSSSTRQSILPSSNGNPTIKNVGVGYYEVLITEIATGCTEANLGAGIIEVQDQTFLPEVFFTELAPQTSCDPLQPNGRIQADAVFNGTTLNPADFTFEWFEGQNTTTAHLGGTSGINGQIAENVKGGGQAYTVRITTANQCSVTRDTIVTEMIVFPQVLLSTTPNSVCDQTLGFTGSVLSTVTFNGASVTAPNPSYSFKWYDGPVVDPAKERVADLNKQNLTLLDSGFYTLVVTNEVLHCPSVARVEQVMSIKALPVIATGSQASTNCAPAMPGNGSAFVSDVDNGSGTGTPYTYQWFDNTNTAIVGATQPVLGNIQGPANFTVLVRNNDTGCENTAPEQVADGHIIPSLSAMVNPDNICDANLTAPGITRAGAVNATIDNQGTTPITDFSFNWVADDGNINLGINAPSITQLDSGFYTLTVANIVTGCVSNPLTRFVPTTTSYPIIETLGTPSSNCLPAVSGNGRVEVTDVDNNGLSGQYVFQWYTTNDTTGTKINGATQAFMDGIQGGNNVRFTVLVIDQSNGCASTAVEQVLDIHREPVIQLTPSPNDICNDKLTDPATPFTGSVSSTITNLGVSPLTAALADYQFTWTDLEDGSILKDKVTGGAAGGEVLLNRDSSDYSLVVIHAPTGCVSNLAVATVTLDVQLPAIVTGTISSTNCLPGFEDGSGFIDTIDGISAPNANFSHQWYATQDTTGTMLTGQTNFNIVNRQGGATGYYTVLVTNLTDGCQNTATLQIPDNKTRPVITLGSTDNLQCEGLPNGTAFLQSVTYKGTTLTRPDPFAGFTFGWKSGQTTFEIINQPKGTYKLAVTSNVGCTSDTVSVDINNDLVFPNTVFTAIPQTSCNINTPNGEIFASVDVPGNTAGYNYSWFTNAGATVPLDPAKIEPGNPFHAITLTGNRNYTVMVQNSTTLCRDTATTFLQEILRIPTISLTAKDIFNCNDPGQVEATITVDLNDDGVQDVINMTQPANIARYLLTWYRGTTGAPNPALAETSYLLTQLDNGKDLPVGNYAAFVIDDITKCFSPVEFDFVNGPGPLFAIDDQPNVLPPSCGDPRGAITAFVTTGGPTVDPARYSFEWYEGTPIDPSKTFYTDPKVDFLGDSLDVDAGNIAGTGVYTPGPLPGMQTPVSQKNGATLYGVESGTYTVVVRIVDATDPAFGCAEYHVAYLPFIDEPSVIIASITPDDCLGDNGSVGFQILSPSGNASDYKAWLIEGSNPILEGPNDPIPLGDVKSFTNDPTQDIFTNLASNTYTLVAQEDINVNPALNGCFSAPVTFTLTEALPPNLSGFASKTNSNCGTLTLGDGAIDIQFSLRPDDPYHPNYQPQPSPPAQFPVLAVSYEVEVLEVNTSTVTMPFGTFNSDPNNSYSATIPDLRDGSFEVTVKANETGCSATKTFTVNPQPVVAQLVAGDLEIDDSFKCLPDGAIEVVSIGIIGGGVGLIDEYQFRWYANSTDANANANVITSGQGDTGSDIGGDYFDAVALARPAGVYWVVAEKTTGPGTGCLSAPFSGNIKDKSVKPTIKIDAFSNTACTNPNLPPLFEGSLRITVTNPGSLPSPSGYTYSWLEATASSGLKGTNTAGDGDGMGFDDVPPDDDNPNDLEDGFYKLTGRNIETGCTRDAEATIDRTQLPIIISESTHTDQLICDPDGTATVVQVLVNNLPAPRSDFEFFWHRGSINTPTVLQGLDEFTLNPGNYNDPVNGTVMGAGTFNVVAVRVLSTDGGPGYGCPSPQKTETVLNKSKKPVMSITPFVNTSCSDITFEGSLQINVTDEGSAPAGAMGYFYTWTQSPAGSPLLNSDFNNANGINDGDQDNPTGLIDGTYKLVAKNKTTGCIANEVQAIITPATTPVVIAKKDFLDRFVCAPAGRAFVTQVTVGSLVYNVNNPATTPPFPTEIDFSFYEGFPLADNSNLVLSGIGESQLDSLNFPTIKATTYYVVAQNKLGPGLDCKSVEERIDISDRSRVPEFNITPSSNTSCDLSVFDGSLRVVVVNPGSLPATNGYDYTWVSTPVGGVPPSSDPNDPTDNMNGDGAGADGDNPTGLKDGAYTLNLVNTNTQCVSKNTTATIGIEGRPNVSVSLSKMDKEFCLPSGKVIVNSVLVGSTTFDNTQFANFDFEYFEGSATGQSVLQGNAMGQLDSVTYAHPDPLQNIKAQTNYFVVARKVSVVGLSCESLPKPIQFNDITNRPIPTLHAFANSTCTLAFLNGAIKIEAKDNSGPGVGSLYDYEYFYDDGANPPVGPTLITDNNGNGINDGDLDSLMNLRDGKYTFTIRNQVTQCVTPSQVVIRYDPIASKPNVVTVDKNIPFDCLGNGGDATVTAIRIGSNPAITGSPTLDPPNFGYDWYDNGTDPFLNPAPPGNIAPVVPNGRFVNMLRAGTYYVTVRDLQTDCKSTPTQVVIDSANIVYPAVLIRQTVLQLSCDPADGTAELQATADGQDDSNATYTFTWYNSLDGTGTTVIDPWPGSQSTISDLTSGNYSVTVFNSITGCETTRLFIIPPFDPKFFPKIVTSGDPQSSCLLPNGSVVVRVIPFPVVNNLTYDPPYNFRVDLYNGDLTANPGLNQEPPTIAPDMANLPPIAGAIPPGSFIADPLDDGVYTVRLYDANTSCITVEKATVIDDRRRPVPKLVVENPLTNCDTRFNGQLSASADNRAVTNYNFYWWSEVNPSDTITRNDKLIGQDQGKYFVSIVNKVSGCDTLINGVIPVDQVLPQAPSIALIQPQTICWEDFYPQEPLARPNGWLQASVGGETLGFRFEWFTGQHTNQQVAGMTPDTTGINNLHLISQFYTVKAVILATGCSNVASLLVPDERIIPTGIVETTPSYCEDARLPSGSVILQQTNTENVPLRQVTWFNDETNAFVGDGIQVFGVPPGFYRAEFLSNEFCYNEAVGKVQTEILAYNLVSSNSDGSNDTWIIDCISNFTIAGGADRDNNVKIFNRYGVKVYEADGYNNADIVFRGVGESGIYALRDQLPDGTYFYVIDKRDGSRPITGFLELVR